MEWLIGNIKRVQSGLKEDEIACIHCLHVDARARFEYGRGREFGQHPDHRYCPECRQSIDWFGYIEPLSA